MINSTKNTLWNPEDVDLLFRTYEIFEQKLMDVLKVFPLTLENEKSWSPELVNLFLDINSLIDSIARHIIGQGKDQNGTVQVREPSGTTSKKIRDFGVEDFELNLFAPEKMLESRVVVYVYPLEIISPFCGYRNDDGWWKKYNLLKHNRITRYRQANLTNTLHALGALFLLLVRHKDEEFTKALLRFDIVKTDLMPEFVHRERLNQPDNFWYDSELFGTPELAENIQSEDVSRIQPWIGSRKLHIYVGRFNARDVTGGV